MSLESNQILLLDVGRLTSINSSLVRYLRSSDEIILSFGTTVSTSVVLCSSSALLVSIERFGCFGISVFIYIYEANPLEKIHNYVPSVLCA